jgi:uncharacterized protein YbjT (DUF2867 family)
MRGRSARIGRENPGRVRAGPGRCAVSGHLPGAHRTGRYLRSPGGVAHPSPKKALEFEAIDYTSAAGAIAAAREMKASHFVYLSVAHPAPVMQPYWSVRARCEELLHATGIPSTVLRPWYVLGPGHWWPLALVPFYLAAERIPSARESAKRLGLVTIGQMTSALERAIAEPA